MHCVVTGASRGIGLAFVRRLLERDAVTRVFAACRDPANAPLLADLASSDGRVQVIALDVTDEATIVAAAAAVAETTATVDVVINCAGFLHDERLAPEKRVEDASAMQLGHSFAVNASGVLLVAKHFRRLLPRRARCVFANLSARVGSIEDNRAGGWYAYRASKAAQNMITKTLAIELARKHRGVICLALHPGTTDTELSKPFQRSVPASRLFSPERAAGQLLGVIERCRAEDNGSFLDWKGEPIPW